MARVLNTKEAQAGFGCAHMTLYNYQQPHAERDALPSQLVSGRRVFKLADCQKFAKKNGLTFTEPAEQPLAQAGRKSNAEKAAEVKKPAKAKPVVKKAATAVKQSKPKAAQTVGKGGHTKVPPARDSAKKADPGVSAQA